MLSGEFSVEELGEMEGTGREGSREDVDGDVGEIVTLWLGCQMSKVCLARAWKLWTADTRNEGGWGTVLLILYIANLDCAGQWNAGLRGWEDGRLTSWFIAVCGENKACKLGKEDDEEGKKNGAFDRVPGLLAEDSQRVNS
jgi:hypothetical protein